MSSQPITSSSFSNQSSGLNLSSLGNNGQLQITGLASGLDTNAVIKALIAVDQQPITNLQNQQNGLTATNQQLSSIQTALQQLVANAQALSSPTLFANSQTVTSTNPTLVAASAPSGVGAVVGGYQVAVSSLATSAQRTFTFTSPSAADTVTIDGQQISLASGAQPQDFVNAVNSNSNLDVWATVTNTNTVVLSSRSTGNLGSSYIQVSDTAGALTENTALAKNGQDAAYTINGQAGTSHTDTVTNAIPGVTLTLNGTTGGTAVGVTVGAPGPSQQSVQTAVQTFISSYNSVLTQIQGQLNQAPVTGQPTVGTLYGDPGLRGLLNSMRSAMDASASGLASGMNNMLNIGVSTGAASGVSLPSQNSINGQLTLDATTLTSALQSNPTGVQQLLKSWAQSFGNVVNAQAAPGGTISQRIQSDSSQISQLGNRIASMNEALQQKQTSLQQQFAAMEAALSQNASTSSWLTSQINSLPTP